MLTKEIGFLYLLNEVFSVQGFSPEDLNRTDYFELAGEYSKVKTSGHDKINEYLSGRTQADNKTLLILGVMSTFAYSHPSETIVESASSYIRHHFHDILKNLEANIPLQDDSFYEKGKQFYSQLISLPFSYKLLETVSHTRSFQLIKESHNYGIRYLLAYMARANFDEFDEWFNDTKRTDLKILFVAFIFDSFHVEEYVSDIFQQSNSALLRTISIFRKIPISRYFPAIQREYDIRDLQASPIPSKEKACVFLYYLIEKYRGLELNKIDDDKKLIDALAYMGQRSFMRCLDVEALKEFSLHTYNYEIVRRLVQSFSDESQRDELLVYLHQEINRSVSDEYLTVHNLMSANVLGRVLVELDDKYTQDVERLFGKVYLTIHHPYFSQKHNRLWSTSIIRLMFYLIALFVKFSSSGQVELLTAYIAKYEDVKCLYHQMDDVLDDIMGQITCEKL